MVSQGASWRLSACLHRVSWLVHARAVEVKLHDLKRAVKAGFDPNQPRVPAGNPDGGQWTSTGGGEANSGMIDRIVRQETGREDNRAPRLAASDRQEECEQQYERDIFQCRMVGLASCYAQAMVRRVACEKGHPIPPLNY